MALLGSRSTSGSTVGPDLGTPEWRRRFELRLRSQARLARLGSFFSVSPEAPRFIEGNRAVFLPDGRDQWRWMLAAIEAAQSRIDLEMYIVSPDSCGVAVRDALVRAAARGVAVRVLWDSVGSSDAGAEFFEPIREAGGAVAEFNPVAPWRLRVSRIGKVQAWEPNTRDHRKLLLVDVPEAWSRRSSPDEGDEAVDPSRRSSLAILGGRNLAEEYLARPFGDGQWRDCGAVLFGPVVGELAKLFDSMWFHAAGDDRHAPPFEVAVAGDAVIMPIGSQPGFFNLLQWSLAHLAWSTTRELRISCAYFIPSRRWQRALRAVAKRARCLLLLPKESDLPIVDAASRHFWGKLLSAGVAIHQHVREILHEKTLIYDGTVTVIGSSNLDPRSFRLNYELSILVVCDRFSRAAVAHHEESLQHAEPFTYAMWRERSLVQRLVDWFWSLFRRQL
jgi:cardiolipin synthase